MKIVCFGDSLTSCGGENGRYSDILQNRFPEHQIVNRGVGGESFVEGLARLEADVLAEKPDIVLVEFGANDWWRNERPPAAWAADLDRVVTAVQAAGGRAVVLGVFGEYLDEKGRRAAKTYGIDERAVAYRALEEAVARKHGCPYVANHQERIVGRRCCWRDRNHPNEYGNRHVADVLEPVIETLTGSRARPVRRPDLQTTRDMWQEAVALAPHRLAAVDGDRRLTFAEADAIVGRLAAHLAARAAPGAVAGLAPIAPDALAIVMHTSGTTATPKGAMMRHSDLLFNVMAAIAAHGFDAKDVHLLVNPMFHCTALYSSLPTAAYTKTPVVIATPRDPAHLLELVQRERITTFLSIPSVFQQILKLPDSGRYDTSSLRVIAYAGSPMPVSAIARLQQRFPDVALHNFFGLTETISMTHVLRGEDAKERPDSIGRLLPFASARIVDERNAEVPAGTVGELLFARENVIPGYFGDPEKLEQALVTIEGRRWFRTGDLAVADADGYFFIRGRKKDMIIVGGENVFSAEVEAFLMTHPGVDEAAVRGVPAAGAAAFLGEQVEAYVVRNDPALTAQELRRYAFERLPSYKVPARIHFLDALPRNPAGKVVKDDLRPPAPARCSS
jgi:acyl-CoA synthetase (AMP-forming)/AMP-acid ligase II/lysophospholipase L1-like esterase